MATLDSSCNNNIMRIEKSLYNMESIIFADCSWSRLQLANGTKYICEYDKFWIGFLNKFLEGDSLVGKIV